MTFGAEIWGPPLIQAAAAAGSSYLAGQGGAGKETKLQKTKRKLIDQLIGSLDGQGPFSDLFSSDEAAFQKSFVEPAQSMFRNKIAPYIQQSYISSGQQRGTGLDDQLLRAGVDLDAMLNSSYMDFQQQGANRKSNILNSILGAGDGAAPETTGAQDVMSGLSSYLSGSGFADTTSNLFKSPQAKTTATNPAIQRKGFEPDFLNYKLGDPRWGN